jgi:hypothetical protein
MPETTVHNVVPTSTRKPGDDSVTWWLRFGIFFLIITALVVALYGLMIGYFAPSAPRTASEARLAMLETAVLKNPSSGAAQRDYIQALAASGQDDKAWKQLEQSKKQLKGLELVHADLAELDLRLPPRSTPRCSRWPRRRTSAISRRGTPGSKT